MLRQLAGQSLGLNPFIAFQSNSPSDNHRLRHLARIRQWCGGLALIQKANEFYHRRRAVVVAVHLMALAALVIIGLWWLN